MSPLFSPSQKKVIFFDMNNTLVDRRQCFDSAFVKVIDEYTARWEPDDFTWTSQDALHSYKLEWSRQRRLSPRQPVSPEELRQICLQKGLQPFPVAVNPAFSRSFFSRVEQEEDSYVTVFPGVMETLEALSERYKLAIISNGERTRLESNLANLKLDKWISEDRLFSSKRDGIRKPQSAIYETAMEAMKVTPEQCVMVGNSWKNDVVGPTKCGMDAIWIHAAHIKKVSQKKLGKQKVIIIRAFKHLLDAF
ncbi:HAD family hydrolase [Paenibacillus eucommiae]|uniref:Hydrolase of the HAD superfamily n=1 Tax=Paenibacillus eucommiae TaxID=1355755 RepID=A0ABS4IPD4_9BACL|nr:HAD family hydrolase [Paenibacillus eucommiae]MBP1989419.1 putative hydrolase of the HAD superfamily [Paenibacillus eucommiae]